MTSRDISNDGHINKQEDRNSNYGNGLKVGMAKGVEWQLDI